MNILTHWKPEGSDYSKFHNWSMVVWFSQNVPDGNKNNTCESSNGFFIVGVEDVHSNITNISCLTF